VISTAGFVTAVLPPVALTPVALGVGHHCFPGSHHCFFGRRFFERLGHEERLEEPEEPKLHADGALGASPGPDGLDARPLVSFERRNVGRSLSFEETKRAPRRRTMV
jgi:hypothetical protein